MSEHATPSPPSIDTLLRHGGWLRRLAASLVVDAASADDLAQQTLLQALERPPPRDDHPRAWLAAAVRNLARKLGASDKSRNERERAAATSESIAPTDEVVARAAVQHEVSSAVLALHEPYRTALLLHFFDDLPPRAIAARTGAPVETVRTRIKRGVELVRAELVKQRVGGAAQREWSVGLIALLDRGMRRAVRRALITKASVGTGLGVGATGALGVMGVVGMSTKLKLAAAAIVVAAGTFAVVKLLDRPAMPERVVVSGGARDALVSPSGEPPEPPLLPASVEVVRVAEPRAPAAATGAEDAAAKLPTCVVEGVVRTARGDPASGASVLVAVVEHRTPFASLIDVSRAAGWVLGPPAREAEWCRVEAGADGGFRVDGLAAGATVDVAAVHRDEGLAAQAGLVLEPTRLPLHVELTLERGVVVHGTVRDRDGQPIGDAKLYVSGERGAGTRGERPPRSVWGVCGLSADDDGEYRSPPLPFPVVSVECSKEGFVARTRTAVSAEGEFELRIDFALDPEQQATDVASVLPTEPAPAPPAAKKGSLVLEVVEAASGAPVADFTVELERAARCVLGTDTWQFECPNSPDGRFTIPGLELGSYEVAVHAQGFAPRLVSARVTDDPITSTARVELRRLALSLRGRFVDESSRPVGAAAVVLYSVDGRPALPSPDCLRSTDAAGGFAFDALPEGDYTRRRGIDVVVALRQNGEPFEGEYVFRVCDERGIPAIDGMRHGSGGIYWGSDRAVRLRPGWYTVEVVAARLRCEPVRFHAAPETTVRVELVPDPDREGDR